jgi:LL-H family phage holin
MDPFASDLVNALIMALVPVAVGALGYLAKQLITLVKANISKEQYRMVEALASAAVRSIEQTLRSKAGLEKREAAMALVRAECMKRGITLDEQAIATAIEAAVYQEKIKSDTVK